MEKNKDKELSLFVLNYISKHKVEMFVEYLYIDKKVRENGKNNKNYKEIGDRIGYSLSKVKYVVHKLTIRNML